MDNYSAYCISVPAMEHLPKGGVSMFEESKHKYHIITRPERYSTDKINAHHWTTSYVWNNILPMIDTDFSIGIDYKKYYLVDNNTDLGDFSYHDYYNSIDYKFINFNANTVLVGQQDIIRMNSNESAWSTYHRLYRGAHSISSIEHINKTIGRQLLIIGDSMTVPVIPLIAPYFDKIICLDARSGKIFKKLFEWNKITDVMCMFTTIAWFENLSWYKYIMPYMHIKC